MSYDRADLGYELGYDSEITPATKSNPEKIAFPEDISKTYLMGPGDPPPQPIKITPGLTGYNFYPPDESTKPKTPPKEGHEWTWWGMLNNWYETPIKKQDNPQGAPALKDDAKPAAPPKPEIEKVDVSSDKKEVTVTYKGDQKTNPPKKMTMDQAQADADVKAKLPAAVPDNKPDKPTAGAKLGAVEQKAKPIATPVDNKFGYDLAPDQTPATAPLVKKFGTGNEKEAGAYLRLNPYPTAKTRPNLSAPKLKEEQATWQVNLEKKDLPTLRKEMREQEVDRELADYQKMGIAPDLALGRMVEEGKIEWKADAPFPKEWPKKGETPIKASTLTVKDGWDVSKSQRQADAEKAELNKIPLPKKKGEANLRAEAFGKQTQRLNVYHTWSDKMKKEQGWTQENCDAVIAKLDEKVKLSTMEPTQVAGYFFKEGAYDAKTKTYQQNVLVADKTGRLTVAPESETKVPTIGGKPIRFDNELLYDEKMKKAYDPKAAYDPLTASTIEVHQGTVKATPETKVAQGIAPDVTAQPNKTGDKKDESVKPKELKGDKWLKRWDELDAYAGQVTDKAFADAGFPADEGKKGTGPEAQGAWKIPGASPVREDDPKMNDALALESNRMRQLGFKDPEIQDYHDKHPGRSLDEVQGSFPAPKEAGWNAVAETDRNKALADYKGKIKAENEALEAEGQRMKSTGLSDEEVKEYQRQHPGRKPEDVAKSFPITDTSGAALPKEQLDKNAAAARAEMRGKMIGDTAQALKKMDPKLSDENANLMAEQLYRERTKGASDAKDGSLDGMITERKNVQDDLHLISEDPAKRLPKLKERAATHEVLGYYADGRKLVKGDKNLEKFYGETDAGQHNLELYATSRGIDLNDPAQVAGLRKEMSQGKLEDFSKTYAEAPKGKPANKERAELESKYNDSPSGSGTRKKPDLRGMNEKEKSEKEFQLYSQELQNDWKTISEEKQHKWQKEDKAEEKAFQIQMKKLEYKQQLKQMIMQHEMAKDQALFQAVLNLGIQQLNQITQGLNQALQGNLQAMNQMSMQLVLQGAPPSGKDIYLAMVQKGRYA